MAKEFYCVSTCFPLFNSNCITPMNGASLYDISIDPYVSLVVLSRCAQDTQIFWQVALGKGSHYAARTRSGNIQANFISYKERVADPVIFNNVFFASAGFYDNICTEPA